MDVREKLIKYFSQFPGIGTRQSRRFVYFLLRQSNDFTEELAELITKVKKSATRCADCQRFFFSDDSGKHRCTLCSNPDRGTDTLLVVESDTDLDNIEKQGVYNGQYFVLGGILPVVEENPEEKIRIKELFDRVQKAAKNDDLNEVILATSANPEGENTAQFVQKKLKPLVNKFDISVSTLGRGLSTGTELEYIDADTMENALQNRQ